MIHKLPIVRFRPTERRITLTVWTMPGNPGLRPPIDAVPAGRLDTPSGSRFTTVQPLKPS